MLIVAVKGSAASFWPVELSEWYDADDPEGAEFTMAECTVGAAGVTICRRVQSKLLYIESLNWVKRLCFFLCVHYCPSPAALWQIHTEDG